MFPLYSAVALKSEQVDKVRTGDVIRITNGWCRRTHGELVVSSAARSVINGGQESYNLQCLGHTSSRER